MKITWEVLSPLACLPSENTEGVLWGEKVKIKSL